MIAGRLPDGDPKHVRVQDGPGPGMGTDGVCGSDSASGSREQRRRRSDGTGGRGRPQPAPEQQVDTSGGLLKGFLIVSALFVGSILLGNWISKATRLADQSLKFTIIVFAVLASSVVCILGWPPKLGIDLSGGLILIYSVDEGQMEPGQTSTWTSWWGPFPAA